MSLHGDKPKVDAVEQPQGAAALKATGRRPRGKPAASAAAAYEDEEIESGEKRYEPYVLGKPFTAYERAGDYVQQHSAMFGGAQSPPLHAQLDAYRPPPSTDALLDVHRLPHRYAEAVVHTKPKPRVSNIKIEQPPPPPPSPNTGPSPEPQPAQDRARFLIRRELAKVRNDPSFAFNTSNSNVPPKAAVKPGYKAQVVAMKRSYIHQSKRPWIRCGGITSGTYKIK
ncbi:unnamed protein product [Arctogadus glacialis]